MYDLIIIGGGPAGITAAIYAMRKRVNTLLVSENMGGKTNYQMSAPGADIHQVIRGVEVINNFRRELEYLDFAQRLEAVQSVTKREDDVFVVKLAGGDELLALSVIVATGSRVRRLNVPGEQQFAGRGLSYSAVSHAPLFVGKHTTVIGDGMLAIRAVAELMQVADMVHLVAPTRGQLDAPMAKYLMTNPMKLSVFEGYTVKAIEGSQFAERVIVEAPHGAEAEIHTDGVFVELDLIPNSEVVKNLVNLDSRGRIIVDNLTHTNCLGLFAAGDVTNAYAEQVLVAIGEGAKAALSACEYLGFRKLLTESENLILQ
jgi:alkyl hydroperoxide reductase subunit F